MKDHHINVFHSPEDGGYIAEIPDLQGCSAFGSTPHEAIREVVVAKRVWIEAALAEGRRIPDPEYRPASRGTTG